MRADQLVERGQPHGHGGVLAGRHIAETVPDAQLIEFPDVAHMIQLEEPERFNRLVIDFLAGADLSR